MITAAIVSLTTVMTKQMTSVPMIVRASETRTLKDLLELHLAKMKGRSSAYLFSSALFAALFLVKLRTSEVRAFDTARKCSRRSRLQTGALPAKLAPPIAVGMASLKVVKTVGRIA